jgi:hypothetical protein
LLLTYDWRHPTRDLDAVFENDKTLVRQLAAEIAEARGCDSNWLNDGASCAAIWAGPTRMDGKDRFFP